LTYLRKTYPVSRIEVASYETIDFSGDLTDQSDPGYGRGWGELLLLLSRLRAASVSADPHYALLPTGVPNDGCGGFGSSLGVGASYVGEGSAMAQEVGHIFCRRHAPGGDASNSDPHYPSYGGYPSGSIGEYGFDPASGHAFSPASSHDFMGYCGNYWVSPYTYRALLDVFTNPSADNAKEGVEPTRGDDVYLHLGFSLRDHHRFELESGLTLPAKAIESNGGKTSHRLELRDEHGRLLSYRAVRSRDGHHGSDEELHFLESIPFCLGARRLAFVCCQRHDPVTFEIPRDELKIDFVGPAPGRLGEFWDGVVELQWKLMCKTPDRLAFFLRYTCDGGASWQPVNIGFEWKSCRVDLSRLPGGDDCRFQVIASTILQTATAQTDSFRVRQSPRRAMIAGPSLARRVHRASTLELAGTAHSPDGFAEEGELTWSSSLQGHLGNGSYLTVHDLVPGEHEIKLTAPDGLGGQTEDVVMIRVPVPRNS
jgi:hypothetical protein